MQGIKRTLHLGMTLYELTFEFVLEFGKDSNGKLYIKGVTTKHEYKDYSLIIHSYNNKYLVDGILESLANVIKGLIHKYLLQDVFKIQEKINGVGTEIFNIIRRALLECEEYYTLECLMIPF